MTYVIFDYVNTAVPYCSLHIRNTIFRETEREKEIEKKKERGREKKIFKKIWNRKGRK